jgi:hypothetical protein
MRLSRPLGVALLVGSALLAMPAAVQAVTCGQRITANTTVQNDLINCPGDGLVIAAHGITLDLNGHTIDGDGQDPSGDGDVGIINGYSPSNPNQSGGYDRVTIKNGRSGNSRSVCRSLASPAN